MTDIFKNAAITHALASIEPKDSIGAVGAMDAALFHVGFAFDGEFAFEDLINCCFCLLCVHLYLSLYHIAILCQP
ncbi:MAG TPA: hypothetical protein VNV43_12430, partial [Candidatus Acidoferrales bacterium]|nr:hypothetical protein [Candidatus Acidoferrales bacterium]